MEGVVKKHRKDIRDEGDEKGEDYIEEVSAFCHE